MLEVIGLTKVYKTKGGADVGALDGVSLRFPETGMVFLLGKSGSGKSTLLNVCGGLDSPTGGEIVVKGRSSRDFTQSDFDSYRNTFVGFVFQEYNILNEFSVEDNIALALELQGKPKDKQKIAEILEEVDLTGYAKRKPNTLSGGQKQRIAIARALVKSPEIIMADEPTGALDSATGRQVFETLKKLSENKLVLVVSHDREFAEQYGDRIIELKDGKVISDVTKMREARRSLGKNLTAVGTDTLCVHSGAMLTDDDFDKIRDFLAENAGDVVIAGGQKDVASFKKAARINDAGEKETFKETEAKAAPPKRYSAEESRFIRSKLPVRHALKIGASGLKSKPLRLIFTILLSTVSFVMFGLLSTMMLYDGDTTLKKSLMSSDYSVLQLNKQYKTHYIQYHWDEIYSESDALHDTAFTPAEFRDLKEKYGEETLGAVDYRAEVNNASTYNNGSYYIPQISYAISASDAAPLTNKLVAGSFPEKETEICVSSYLAEAFVKIGLHDENDRQYSLKKPEDLLGKQIVLDSGTFAVSGIFFSPALPAAFDAYKDNAPIQDWELRNALESELGSGLYQSVVFHDGYMRERFFSPQPSKKGIEEILDYRYQVALDARFSNDRPSYGCYYLSLQQSEKYLQPYFFGSAQSSLRENEALIPSNLFVQGATDALSQKQTELSDAFWLDQTDTRIEEFNKDLFPDNETSLYDKLYFLDSGYDFESNVMTVERSREIVEETRAFCEKWKIALQWNVSVAVSSNSHSVDERLNVKGTFFLADKNNRAPLVLLSDTLCAACDEVCEENNPPVVVDEQWTRTETTRYVEPEDAVYDAVFISYDRSAPLTNTVVAAVYKWAGDDSRVTLDNAIAYSLTGIDETVEDLAEIFLWVGLVLALFAALLLCNFISVSITYKKKEIGILRAVGARSFDVFKIFFSESFLITAICVVLSAIGGGIVCAVLNQEVGALLSGVTIFVFGPLSVLMLIGVAFLTAVIATFLPVYHAAGKKPVESIRAL